MISPGPRASNKMDKPRFGGGTVNVNVFSKKFNFIKTPDDFDDRLTKHSKPFEAALEQSSDEGDILNKKTPIEEEKQGSISDDEDFLSESSADSIEAKDSNEDESKNKAVPAKPSSKMADQLEEAKSGLLAFASPADQM